MLYERDFAESDIPQIWNALQARIRASGEKKASFAHKAGMPEHRLKDLSRTDSNYRPNIQELVQVSSALGTSLEDVLEEESGVRNFVASGSGYTLVSYFGLYGEKIVPFEIAAVKVDNLTDADILEKRLYLEKDYDLSGIIELKASKAQLCEMKLWANYVKENYLDPQAIADAGGIGGVHWMNLERHEFYNYCLSRHPSNGTAAAVIGGQYIHFLSRLSGGYRLLGDIA